MTSVNVCFPSDDARDSLYTFGVGNDDSITRRWRTAVQRPHRPVGRAAQRNFFPALVEKESTHMLRGQQAVQVVRRFSRPAFFVSADRLVQRRRAQRFPRRTARLKCQRHQNGQHHEQRLRHPERQKDSQKKTLHSALFNPFSCPALRLLRTFACAFVFAFKSLSLPSPLCGAALPALRYSYPSEELALAPEALSPKPSSSPADAQKYTPPPAPS